MPIEKCVTSTSSYTTLDCPIIACHNSSLEPTQFSTCVSILSFQINVKHINRFPRKLMWMTIFMYFYICYRIDTQGVG